MRLFGVVGKHLGHSFSPSFFADYFKTHKIDAEYKAFEIDNIAKIENIFQRNPSGLNVTIPYKESIIPYVDELDEIARTIQAVNTVCFEDGKIVGRNTDAIGFKRMVQPFLTSRHERAMIIGTGGASKAVQYVLRAIGIDIIFISRSKKEGNNYFLYEDINAQMLRSCKLIIHTTPVGMYPAIKDSILMPFEVLTEDHLVIDLIYNPEQTLFLKNAKENGAQTLNGLSMLQEQALESWRLWN